MVKPINHDGISTLSTTGWETAKVGVLGSITGAIIGTVGGAISGLIAMAVPALVVAAVGAAILSGGGALIGLFSASAGAMAYAGAGYGLIAGGAVAAVGAVTGAVGGLLAGAGYGAVGGGLLGLLKGGSRVKAETKAYAQRMQAEAPQVDAQAIVAIQRDAFEKGGQAREAQIVSHLQQLQQMQQSMIAEQMAEAEQKKGGFAAKEKCGCSHAEKVEAGREALAAAANQLG